MIESWTTWVSTWNANLTALASNFCAAYPDATTFLFDTYQLFNDVIDDPCSHPETCEFKDTTTSCDMYAFGTPDFDTKLPECEYRVDEYLWMNDINPSTRMYNLTARAIFDALLEE